MSRYNFWLNQPGTLRDSAGCLIKGLHGFKKQYLSPLWGFDVG